MSSRKIFWLGLIFSILFIYVCSYLQKDNITKICDQVNQNINIKKTIPVVTKEQQDNKIADNELDKVLENIKQDENGIKKTLKPSTFKFILNKKVADISGNIPSSLESEQLLSSLETICSSLKCNDKLNISDKFENITWQLLVGDIIQYFVDNKIANIDLNVKENRIIISGLLESSSDKKDLNNFIKTLSLDDIVVYDETNVIFNEEKVKKVQDNIDDILKKSVIKFQLNSNDLTDDSKITLNKIATLIQDITGVFIEISGHTDASGNEFYNLSLSQKRADVVKAYLVSLGIDSKIISSVGFGEKFLISKNKYSKKNRRVEIRLIKRK